MDSRVDKTLKTVPIHTRIIAFLWDYLIIAVYLILLIGVSFLAKPLLVPLFSTSPLLAQMTGFGLITLPVYLYFAVSEGTKYHATWGKRKMGIAVTSINGKPIGLGSSLFRSALKFVPWELAHFTIWRAILPSGYSDQRIYALFAAVYGLALIYLISSIWSNKNQAVYDFIAGTVVVKYKED